MNKDQKLLEEAYQSIYESAEMHPDIKRYIERGCKGNLSLDMEPITSLPTELKKVEGDLRIYKTKITSLPEDLVVQGTLDVSFTPISSLPKGLKVGGSLFLMQCENIETIPSDLQVRGDLNLNYTNITSLPEGIDVGSLQLAHSKITSLPKNLKLRGNLNLARTPISSLPKGLEVGGTLNLKGSGITKVSQLPIDLKAERIESWDFTQEDFERHEKLTKELSKDFGKDLEALDDFS